MSEMLLAARPRARVRPLFLARRWYGALSRPIANHEGIHPWGIDLIFLNALGLVLCVVLIAAAATNNDPLLVGQVTKGVKLCLRLFVAGAALPTVGMGNLHFFQNSLLFSLLAGNLDANRSPPPPLFLKGIWVWVFA